ncbi:C5AR1 protein, partial [Hirundo rustica]|nr:C5AR1 protein [Hirundo rustica]
MAAPPTSFYPWDDAWNLTWNDTWGDLYEEPGAAAVPPGHRAVLALYAAVFLLGVAGNGAVLWVTAAELRRTVNGVWFSHLALADLLSCLALPFVALPLATDHHWPLGAVACKLLPSLTVLAMFAGVLVLTAISADRCALVTRPVWCHNRRTPALASAACAGAWALAALLTAPSFVFRAVRLDPFSAKATCVMSYGAARRHGRGAELATAAARFLCGFLVPFAVISGCYGRLLSRLRARGLGGSQRATGTVLVVVVSFFVCWLPYHVVGLVLAVGAPGGAAFRGAQAADPAAAGLAYVNGCVNPVIYLVMGRGLGKVKRSWRALLKGVLSDEPTSAAGDARAKSAVTAEEGSEG